MEPSEKQHKKALALLTQYPRGHALAAGLLVGGLSLLSIIGFPSNEVSASREIVDLELPEMATLAAPVESGVAEQDFQPASPDPLEPQNWQNEPDYATETFTVQSGDSLSKLFKRAGLTDRDLYELISESSEAGALRRIMPGHQIGFKVDQEGRLHQLVYEQDRLSDLVFTREDATFVASKDVREPDVHIAYRQATIDSSLFMAGQSAGMSDNLIMELASIFGWDIDFILDIRRGDTFNVLYEEKFLDGEKIGYGAILAAEFINRGKTYQAVRYVNRQGSADYYTPEGQSMRKEFLRTPVDFTRISSPFNPNRRHPVLNTIRAHKGTDYAAGRGTPVRAAGDGRVIFAGRKGGYGNTVIIKHGQRYQTLYAHMHNFRRGIRSGTTVKQGQTIGYVGSTGLATGPHLHYEFYVNGTVRNPVTVELPKAQSVPEAERARFETQTQPIMAQLKHYHQATKLAMNETDNHRVN